MNTKASGWMKSTAMVIGAAIMVMGATSAFAGDAVAGMGKIGLGAAIFLGVLALIIVAQLIPGLVLFGSLMTALFSKSKAKAPSDEASAMAGEAGEPR